MWPLRRRARGDYAPSRVAYRVNRLWLSPRIRLMAIWVLPLGAAGGAAWLYMTQPEVQARITFVKNRITEEVRAQEDFLVKGMAIMGASPELAREIRRRVDVAFPVSVLDLDLDDIRARVTALDAVAEVQAQVMLGGALALTVTERTPAVVWRTSAGLALLDAAGHRVAVTDRREGAPDLPLIAGLGADRAVPQALRLMAAAAPLQDRLRGLVRQGERRWDVVLTDDVVIQLPEPRADVDPVVQLERVIAFHEAGDLLNRDVGIVDMRNPDRPTIRLGAQAFAFQRTLRAFDAAHRNGD